MAPSCVKYGKCEPILFLLYVYDLSLRINSLAEPILFVDDTSVFNF
jgi:hypothetical protein